MDFNMLTKYYDKIQHFTTGYMIADAFAFNSIPISLGAATIAGIGKELYDKYKGSKFDWLDLGCTILGSVVRVGVSLVYKELM